MSSRPLPVVPIEYPSAERGADDSRAHLDGPRCVFCDVPVADGERWKPTDFFGTLRSFHICKGHSEHPESWHRATNHDPERMVYCRECGDPANLSEYYDACSTCDPLDIPTPEELRA